MTLGRLPDAVADARQSITYADQSGDACERMNNRTTAADALHQSGQRAEAGKLFAEAERMQKERQPELDLLCSLPGFRYCDWLLAPAERAAWQALLRGTGILPLGIHHGQAGYATICDEVERRASRTLRWAIGRGTRLTSRHRPRPPDAGPRRPVSGDSVAAAAAADARPTARRRRRQRPPQRGHD